MIYAGKAVHSQEIIPSTGASQKRVHSSKCYGPEADHLPTQSSPLLCKGCFPRVA